MPLLTLITSETIARGVAETRWRGRLERFEAGGKEVWVDGCHNGHAIAAVLPFIEANLPRPRLLVFGIMGDKDVAAVAREIFPLFDEVITTEPFPPRSANSEELAEMARAAGRSASAVREPHRAMERALESAAGAVFVGGSLYLAGAAIEFLDAQRKKAGQQQQ